MQPMEISSGVTGGGAQYGYHTSIQTVNGNNIQIAYKAQYDYFCCSFFCGQYDSCLLDRSRKYLYVLENGYERSHPGGCSGNVCCMGTDSIFKAYFDRGVYDQQACCWKIGFNNGAPTVYANNVTYVCFCQECSPDCNNFLECYWPELCGDRVRVLPSENCCWCFPMRSCWFHNCCGLCGPKNGEPLPSVSYTFEGSLAVGSGVALAQAMESSRAAWKARTGNV
eukprot:gene8581-9454_t